LDEPPSLETIEKEEEALKSAFDSVLNDIIHQLEANEALKGYTSEVHAAGWTVTVRSNDDRSTSRSFFINFTPPPVIHAVQYVALCLATPMICHFPTKGQVTIYSNKMRELMIAAEQSQREVVWTKMTEHAICTLTCHQRMLQTPELQTMLSTAFEVEKSAARCTLT